MYADDLVLISGSVVKLQEMINMCINELEGIDLKINVKKTVCLKFGKNCKNNLLHEMSVGASTISWSASFKYLGINIVSASKFMIDLKPARAKFYRSFNSVYSKISKANEFLIISLVKTFCVPSLLFGLEAIDLNVSTLHSLDTPYSRAFGRIFNTFDNNVINSCMFYSNCWSMSYEYFNRRINFLQRLKSVNNDVIKKLSQRCYASEIDIICKKLKINCSDLFPVKKCLWNSFQNIANIL
jgi:hypothetical protein